MKLDVSKSEQLHSGSTFVYLHSSEPLSDTKCLVSFMLRFWSAAAQAEALGFQIEAPARANLRVVKIHTRAHTHIVYSVISGIAILLALATSWNPRKFPFLAKRGSGTERDFTLRRAD